MPGSLSTAGGRAPARVMPDVAAVADDRTGMLIGLTAQLAPGAPAQYVEGRVGGTSLATPLFAGIQADGQRARLAAHGRPLGFANPALYRRYRTPAYRDVTDQPFGPGVPVAMADEERALGTGQLTDLAVTLARDTSLHATRGEDGGGRDRSPPFRRLRWSVLAFVAWRAWRVWNWGRPAPG